MLKDEWDVCIDPQRMFSLITEDRFGTAYTLEMVSDRKLRLIACACWRVNGNLSPTLLLDIRKAERMADGDTSIKPKLLKSTNTVSSVLIADAYHAALAGVSYSTFKTGKGNAKPGDIANVIQDIVYNPFADTIPFDQKWLTETVLSIADSIYKDRSYDPVDMFALADALKDTGCPDEICIPSRFAPTGEINKHPLIQHLRDTKLIHYRGCWAIDTILGNR